MGIHVFWGPKEWTALQVLILCCMVVILCGVWKPWVWEDSWRRWPRSLGDSMVCRVGSSPKGAPIPQYFNKEKDHGQKMGWLERSVRTGMGTGTGLAKAADLGLSEWGDAVAQATLQKQPRANSLSSSAAPAGKTHRGCSQTFSQVTPQQTWPSPPSTQPCEKERDCRAHWCSLTHGCFSDLDRTWTFTSL